MEHGSVLVTGGAGFIGSHLVDRLVAEGRNVIVLDNLTSGDEKNLVAAMSTGRVRFVHGDLLSMADIAIASKDCETVFHFAANPEVRLGDPLAHFETNIRGTFNVLETMRKTQTKGIVFASTSTVYGDATVLPTPEIYSPLRPISVYGASKLACESLISAYCESYGLKAIILRFANIVGSRMRHGVIHEFVQKLKANPKKLEILGDGMQRKSYLLIDDAIQAIGYCLRDQGSNLEVYNIGSDDDIDVKKISEIIVEELGLINVAYNFTGGVDGGRGWIGDVKFMKLDISKLKSTGWLPKHDSEDAVRIGTRAMIHELTQGPLH